MTAVTARFKGKDKDHDGKVTRAEFTGVPANFDRIDTDKDGALSKDEITKFFSARVADGGAALPKAAAKARAKAKADADVPSKPKADAKTDGDAKKKETAKPKSDEESADLAQRFKFLDKDGDGKISKAEFLREKLFDRLDADKDGFLSPVELAKFMKADAETPEKP
jgi:Ca2+-binding EF-hand superfamily protein